MRKVRGVRGVLNKIEVKPSISAVEVKAKIEDALRRRAEVNARRILVSTDGGAVTLAGDVHSRSERDVAEHAAWAIPGVCCVIDHISIVP